MNEFFFDDDTFTANLPRAREIAKKLAPLGLTWSCNSRANLDYDTIKSFKDSGLRLFLVGYESGNEDILTRIKKGVTMDEMRRFTKACHQAGVVIHGTFILGLPVETPQSIENTIRFAHDRIQEAAYSLIAEVDRAREHVRIGRLLLAWASG